MSDKIALKDLSSDLIVAQTLDQFNKIVNQEPPEGLVKNHPTVSGVKYMPIDKVEGMLSSIFQQHKIEILDQGQLLNAVYVSVRLHYKHPATGEWMFHDGLGATAIQVDKGMNSSDLGAIKSNAIMLALPAAKSYAIKDAAEHIGRLFGRDLNRKDTMNFASNYISSDEAINKKRELREKAGIIDADTTDK
jgi:hypothetical protein